MKQLATIFVTIFLAEFGDKTQLATLLFATEKGMGKTGVFFAAAAALVVSSGMAVGGATIITKLIPESPLRILAGIGFIAVGIWTLL